jgi:putative cardiolipin synthase
MGRYFDRINPDPRRLTGVRTLSDPRTAFRARFAFAAQARKTLDLQYYLWKGDTTGQLLLWQALRAADRGVQVRILIDDIYHSGRDIAYAAIDQHPNVQVRVFNPIGNRGWTKNLNYVFNKSQLNYRMHNKIFLVDNAVAVLGGRNIGDDYFGIDPKLNFHDLDVLAVGAAARQAGEAYDLYWNSPWAALEQLRRAIEEDLAEIIEQVPYRVPMGEPELIEALEQLRSELFWAEAEVIVDPLDRFEGGAESAFVKLGERLTAELSEEVVIQTAYLIPTEEGIADIRRLTGQGVRFRVMTNSLLSNNHLSVHGHYAKHRKALLEAGAELYELRADTALLEYYKQSESRIASSHSGLHTKAFVVDGRIAMIGSYNMDPRSRIWNSEIGLLVHSPEFAASVLADMNEEFEPGNAYRLSLDEDGKLLWTIEGADGTQTWRKDPEASWGKRASARMMGWLPIEKEL